METQIESERLTIGVDGGAMPAYICWPAGTGPFPAVIVVHEIYGLVQHTEDVARRFAAQGYLTVAPNLLWHIGPPPAFTDRASFAAFRESLDDRQMLASLDATLAALRERPDVNISHIGIVGFCMGAYYAFLEAAANPTLAACVDFYGSPLTGSHSENRPRTILEAAEDLRVPLLGLFGADDPSIPVEQVRDLERVLRKTGTAFEVHVYPQAGHAFFNDASPAYREAAAEDAWPRTLQFFARYLQSRP